MGQSHPAACPERRRVQFAGSASVAVKLRGLPPLAAAAVVLPGQKNLSWLSGVALFAILLISWTAGRRPARRAEPHGSGRPQQARAAGWRRVGRSWATWSDASAAVRVRPRGRQPTPATLSRNGGFVTPRRAAWARDKVGPSQCCSEEPLVLSAESRSDRPTLRSGMAGWHTYAPGRLAP